MWLVLVLACAGCGAGSGGAPGRAGPSASRRGEERTLAWARLGTEAAQHATSACEYYSRRAFAAARARAFEPELHGPCASPPLAALHARIADLALVAAHRAASSDARGEAEVRAELERLADSGGADYARGALASLDATPTAPSAESGCEDAAATVVRGIAALAVQARAEALAACPADSELPPPPSTPYLVPASRCGEAGRAQLHATAAHALLLAATRGATAGADEELAWVHEWVGDAERRGELDAPAYATRALRLRREIEAVVRCAATAELLPPRWEEDSERRRVPGTGLVLRVPRGSRIAHGSVEVGGALEIRLSVSPERPEALLARRPSGAARRVGAADRARFVLREGRPGEAASGVTVFADLGDVTAVLTASHFLPVAAGLWERVAALMAGVERAAGSPPFVPEDLGFVVEAPRPQLVSFEPGRIRFSSGERDVRADFSAALRSGTVMPAERSTFCDPELALPRADGEPARVVARGERTVGGGEGCEIAVVRRSPEGARFEYAAFGFFVDARAEIRVSASAPGSVASDAVLLERARAFADAFALAAPAEAPSD